MEAETVRIISERMNAPDCAVAKIECDNNIKFAARDGQFIAYCKLLNCKGVKKDYEKRGFKTWPIDPQCTSKVDTAIEW